MNLLVVAHLSSPLAGDAPMLDALMEADFAGRQNLSHNCDRNRPCPPPASVSIPIMRADAAGYRVANSSSPIYGPVTDERMEYYTKRFGVEHSSMLHPQERTVMAVGNGTLKAYRLPNQVRQVEQVAWFCVCSGHEIRKWLKRIKSIGKDRSQGYGRVHKWTVTEVEHDYSWFANGVLMRPLPVDAVPRGTRGAQPAFAACQGPYWHNDRMMDVMIPC